MDWQLGGGDHKPALCGQAREYYKCGSFWTSNIFATSCHVVKIYWSQDSWILQSLAQGCELLCIFTEEITCSRLWFTAYPTCSRLWFTSYFIHKSRAFIKSLAHSCELMCTQVPSQKYLLFFFIWRDNTSKIQIIFSYLWKIVLALIFCISFLSQQGPECISCIFALTALLVLVQSLDNFWPPTTYATFPFHHLRGWGNQWWLTNAPIINQSSSFAEMELYLEWVNRWQI